MFRRSTMAVALVSALAGCVARPPRGPFVEYHAGLTPITRPVHCEATYALRTADAAEPLTAHHLEPGERLGFRREADGSVSALAPGHILPLGPGAYRWEVVPGTVAPWRKRLGAEVSPAVPGAIFLAGVAAACGGLLYLVACCGGDDGDGSDSSGGSSPRKQTPPAPEPARTGTRVP